MVGGGRANGVRGGGEREASWAKVQGGAGEEGENGAGKRERTGLGVGGSGLAGRLIGVRARGKGGKGSVVGVVCV